MVVIGLFCFQLKVPYELIEHKLRRGDPRQGHVVHLARLTSGIDLLYQSPDLLDIEQADVLKSW
jgi:hypothetical protein